MAKLLKDITGSKNSSTKKVNDLGGYSPKAGDEQKFVKKHEIQKWEDRNGNGDDVFNATKIKHSQINDTRHGYKNPEDIKVHEAVKCNMTEQNVPCPMHGLKECMSESKLKEDWIVTHSDGRVSKHIGQMDAMRASKKSPGSKVSATHGAMGQKASTVLAPHQGGNIGTFSAAGYTPPEKKKKMREELDLEENKLYHVSWGSGREHQVVAKHGEEAVSKAKDAIIKKIPKLQDKKYSDAFDRKPTVTDLSHERKVQKDRVQEEIEEGFVVRYNNPKSEKHGSEKHFDDQAAAKKHATRGNFIDKVGGKYTVHKTNEKGHDVKEEALDELSKDTLGSYASKAHKQGDMAARMSDGGQKKDMAAIANKRYQGVQTAIKKMREEIEEAMTLKQKAFSNRTKNHPGRKGGVFDTKSNFDAPDHKVHVVVSKGDKKETIKDVVQARDKNEAIFKTQMKFHKMGYKVHDTIHKGMVKEEVEEIDEKAVSQAQQKAAGAALATQRGEYAGGKKGGAVNRMALMKASELRKIAGTKRKGLPAVKESLAVPLLGGDEDESAEMLKTQLKAIANKAMHLVTQLSDDQLIEPWVQSKIAVAKDQVTAVHDYMIYGDHDTEKEQTGPDTPMTFPGMNVDVNSGVNV
jgi:hypothetical protein